MSASLLVLGGTGEAAALGEALAAAGYTATISLAGRVAKPAPQPLPFRIGGFGGIPGMVAYLRRRRITHVIDATHPFAARISVNAVAACAEARVPLLALTRPPWRARPGDRWETVPDIPAAAAALGGVRRRVMLAIGRMRLAKFSANPQHFYLLRTIGRPVVAPPFPDHHVVVARGPFSTEGDRSLMEMHGIELVVSKNSGGGGAYAKIAAARTLGLPVLLIDRPPLPPRRNVFRVDDAMDWIAHSAADLGV